MHLKTLSACDCGLVDLHGVTNAPNLASLAASDNAIADVLPVTELRKIAMALVACPYCQTELPREGIPSHVREMHSVMTEQVRSVGCYTQYG